MPEERKIWHWLVLVTLSLIWGTSYILMKRGLESFSTYQIASLRMLISGVCMIPVSLRHVKKISRENIWSLLLIGFLGSGIPSFLFPLAQTRIDSSVAGMLNSISPVFTLVIGILLYKRKVIKSQVAGIFLGLTGAIGLLYSGSFSINIYGLFVVLATILYGFSSNEVSRVKGLNGLQITSLSFLIMIPAALILLLSTDINTALHTDNAFRNLGYIAILSVVGSAVALAIFYLLIRDTSPVFAAMVTYFIPIVATLWGIADGEKITSSMLVSVALIFSGVYLINRPGILQKLRSGKR
jgi:drug/metabolite transporter (DMT)-like permease